MSKFFQDDIFEKVRPKIKEHLKDVQIIVFGHTHDADIKVCKGKEYTYFNTGTWTPVFSEEDRITREQKQFAFVRVSKKARKKPEGELLQWNHCLQKAEKLILFEPEDEEEAKDEQCKG